MCMIFFRVCLFFSKKHKRYVCVKKKTEKIEKARVRKRNDRKKRRDRQTTARETFEIRVLEKHPKHTRSKSWETVVPKEKHLTLRWIQLITKIPKRVQDLHTGRRAITPTERRFPLFCLFRMGIPFLY